MAKENFDFIKKYGENSDINIRHYNGKNNGELLSFRFNNKKRYKKVIY